MQTTTKNCQLSTHTGYAAFCLYVCPILTDPKQRLVHFTTDVKLEGENSSCRSAKKQKMLEKQKQKCIAVLLEGHGSQSGPILQHEDTVAEKIGLISASTTATRGAVRPPYLWGTSVVEICLRQYIALWEQHKKEIHDPSNELHLEKQ